MKRVTAIILTIFISGCEGPSGNYTFNNDLESIAGWFDQKQIIKGDARSGNYSCLVTPEAHSGITFRKRLADFNNGLRVSRIRAGVWVKFSESQSKGAFIVSIDEPSTLSPIVFSDVKLEDQVTDIGIWQHVLNAVDVPPGTDSNKVVSIYVTNEGKNNIFVDDISYDFK